MHRWRRILILLFTMSICLSSCKKHEPDPVVPASLNQVSTLSIQGGTLYGVWGIAFDASDNLYVADYRDNRIRKVTPDGVVSTFAGSGEEGLKDGLGAGAVLGGPDALAFDAAGNLFVTQPGAIRKITPDGVVSTVVGVAPDKVGLITYDSLNLINPDGLTIDDNQNLYVTCHDGGIRSVWKVAPDRTVRLLLGNKFNSTVYIPSPLVSPNSIAYNPLQKALYVVDAQKGITRSTVNGINYCYTGCAGIYGHVDGPIDVALFRSPNASVVDKAGNLYITDEHFIRKITPDGVVSTVAGTGKIGKDDGAGDQATFNYPGYLAFDSKGVLYVSDLNGIRKIVLGAN